MDREINYNSKHYDKYKSVLKLIRFTLFTILFPFEVVQKRQRFQLCVLWEISNTIIPPSY